MNIQWYPGHMKKTMDMLKADLKLVNIVIEILDARIPLSSRNPQLQKLIKDKKRVLVLNKEDLAEEKFTIRWVQFFKAQEGVSAVPVNSVKGGGMRRLKSILQRIKIPSQRGKRPVRVLVAGIPNVGKSSFINALAGRAAARTGGIPGVTRGKQWIKIPPAIELLDTPGILWPKISSAEMGFHLAVTGAVKFELLNSQELSLQLLEYLYTNYPERVTARFGITEFSSDMMKLLEKIGRRRGYLLSGGEVDLSRTSENLLKEFREGRLGRFTLEQSPALQEE